MCSKQIYTEPKNCKCYLRSPKKKLYDSLTDIAYLVELTLNICSIKIGKKLLKVEMRDSSYNTILF